MDYFVKKQIKKNLIVKMIIEFLSFSFLFSDFLLNMNLRRNVSYILGMILMLFSYSVSFILNLTYIKKKDFKNFTQSLITTAFLLPIGIGINFILDRATITYIILSAYIIFILLSIGISVNIQMILLKPEKQNLIIQRAKEEEMVKQHAIGTSFTADSKKRLFGMIKLKKTLDLKETSEKLGLPQGEIENLLFDLAGENKISGDFKEGVFHITSDVDEFIGQLDDIFSEWSDNEKTKHMKI